MNATTWRNPFPMIFVLPTVQHDDSFLTMLMQQKPNLILRKNFLGEQTRKETKLKHLFNVFNAEKAVIHSTKKLLQPIVQRKPLRIVSNKAFFLLRLLVI